MVRIARAGLVYLLVLLIITGCGTGAATRGSVAPDRTASANSGADPASGETGAPGSGTSASTPEPAADTRKSDGKTQVITFKTEPAGATISIDGKDKYTSPAEVRLTCDVDHSYEIVKDDYEKASGTIRSVCDYQEKSKVPGIIANVAVAGTVGALAGVTMGLAGLPFMLLPIPKINVGGGYKAGPPRLEPDKIAVELAPESP